MLGGKTVCFAVLKWDFHEPGSEIEIQTDGGIVKGDDSGIAEICIR